MQTDYIKQDKVFILVKKVRDLLEVIKKMNFDIKDVKSWATRNEVELGKIGFFADSEWHPF